MQSPAPSGGPRSSHPPVVYGDDRLPVGPAMGQPAPVHGLQTDAIPKLNPGHVNSIASRRSKTRVIVGIVGTLAAAAVIAVVALAASGGDEGETEVAASAGDVREEGEGTGDEPPETKDDGDKAKDETANKDDGDKAKDETANKDDGDKANKDEMVVVAALPISTWGTDETKLASGFTFRDPNAGNEGEGEGNADEGEGEGEGSAAEGKDEPEEAKKPEETKKPEKKVTRVAKRTPRRTRRSRPRRAVRKPVRSRPETPKSSGKSSKDLARAAALYKQKKFSEAASLLRSSSKKASGSDKSKMKKLASAYASVGSNLKKGDANRSNAPAAVTAYNKAMRSDRSAGGAFQTLLRAKIKILAPKAAKTAMARKDLKGAKRMADIAASVGAGSKVSSVRSSLERQAGQLVAAARRDAKAGRKSTAKKKYATAKAIVPKSSKNYRAAVAGLRSL
jgi:hypothetical protein